MEQVGSGDADELDQKGLERSGDKLDQEREPVRPGDKDKWDQEMD